MPTHRMLAMPRTGDMDMESQPVVRKDLSSRVGFLREAFKTMHTVS